MYANRQTKRSPRGTLGGGLRFMVAAATILGLLCGALTGCRRDDPVKPVIVDPGPAPPATFRLNVSVVGNGRVEVSPLSPDGRYPSGTTVVLRATPDPANKFYRWSGGLTNSSPRLEILMTTDLQITAAFHRLEVDLQPVYLLRGDGGGCGGNVWFGAASIQVKNAGVDAIDPPVTIAFRLVDVATGNETDIKVWKDYTNGAPWLPGETRICGSHNSSYGCGPAGYYMFCVVVDPENRIRETDETNNKLTTGLFYINH